MATNTTTNQTVSCDECGAAIQLSDSHVDAVGSIGVALVPCVVCGSWLEIVDIDGELVTGESGRWTDSARPLEAIRAATIEHLFGKATQQ